MVIYKLDLGAACFAVDHARPGGDTYDELFVEWAADGTPWKLCDKHRGGAEDTTFGAAHVLSIDKETRIALCQFYQRFINCPQHRSRQFLATWRVFPPLWHIVDMIHHMFRIWLW